MIFFPGFRRARAKGKKKRESLSFFQKHCNTNEKNTCERDKPDAIEYLPGLQQACGCCWRGTADCDNTGGSSSEFCCSDDDADAAKLDAALSSAEVSHHRFRACCSSSSRAQAAFSGSIPSVTAPRTACSSRRHRAQEHRRGRRGSSKGGEGIFPVIIFLFLFFLRCCCSGFFDLFFVVVRRVLLLFLLLGPARGHDIPQAHENDHVHVQQVRCVWKRARKGSDFVFCCLPGSTSMLAHLKKTRRRRREKNFKL